MIRLFLLLAALPLAAQFDARQERIAERPWARLWGGSFAAVNGERVHYVLVEPKTSGRHPAVLFQHGGGQSMAHYLSEALILADAGVTSLLVDPPLAELVANERRAIDLLSRLASVDPARIAFVGHSYGSVAGGILATLDARPRAFVLLGAAPATNDLSAKRYLPQTRRSVFVQCARFDTPENITACPAVHRLAGGPKRLTWYDEDHNFTSQEAMRDRLRWLAAELQIHGIESALRRSVRRQ